MKLFREPREIEAIRVHARRLLTDPWLAIGPLTGLMKERALRRQISPGHRMQGRRWYAIADDTASDDTMFAAPDGRVAIVHLTYRKESDPAYPHCSIHASVAEAAYSIGADAVYEAAAMQGQGPISCAGCGADWMRDESTPGCGICDGHGLTRPCPVCGGGCAAVWRRAIMDSNDYGHAVWLGACRGR